MRQRVSADFVFVIALHGLLLSSLLQTLDGEFDGFEQTCTFPYKLISLSHSDQQDNTFFLSLFYLTLSAFSMSIRHERLLDVKPWRYVLEGISSDVTP